MSGNRFEATVKSCGPRDSHAWLGFGRARIAARQWVGIRKGQKMAVRIDPEDVLLCENHPGRISARNILPGHVRRLRPVPEGVKVDLQVGFRLTALVTRSAARELRLRRGAPVYAVVKAVAVRPDRSVEAGARVSLAGSRGMLDYDRIDFLRAVERTGSLTSAARELGLTYRTAWMWARAANRVWGRPLVARTQGGKGGGGSRLTPEGYSVVALASRFDRPASDIRP